MRRSDCGWLQYHRESPASRLSLFCFPHAGGAPSFFQSWSRRLPDWINVVSVHYPGRESRLNEPLIADMQTLVNQICTALRPVSATPFAFFGHSVGAAIAHEVIKRLEREKVTSVRLFVSGRRAPQHERITSRFRDGEEKFWNDVFRLGGTPETFIQNTAMRALMLPILRNDYCLSETYLPADLRVLRCPVSALVGDQDAEVTPQQADSWSAVSGGPFNLHIFSGGHFYLIRRSAEVLRIIVSELEAYGACERAVRSK
jgi:pyochelin biosynthesis protein PchC